MIGRMKGRIEPHLEILPPAQRRLWDELHALPEAFVLYGGTALALHLGHRHSVDFDFFANMSIDPDDIYTRVAFLNGSRVVRKEANTLNCLVDRGGPVQVALFGVPDLPRLGHPLLTADGAVRVATLLDLAGTKVAVVQKRAEAKDYLDLDALLTRAGIGLPTALAAGAALYRDQFNPLITLKALSYFDDGNLPTLPAAVRDRLLGAARAVDLDRLPAVEAPVYDPAAPREGRTP